MGGGATGLGTALDAASRGLKTVLLERADFAGGTSSRSTKLVHGGVRYLQQGNVRLVREALKERALLLKNAPHLVHKQQFIVPCYKWWEKPFYGIGLKIYDNMAGKRGLGPSRFLSREETMQHAPTLDPKNLRGGILYYDAQFDDARLALDIALTAEHYGATLLNYFPVTGLLKMQNRICGVWVKDQLTGLDYEIRSRIVINSTGVFADSILKMDDPKHRPLIQPSQGIHLVVDKKFLPGNTAIMIPRTDDGRVLFAVPGHGKLVLGTTDTPMKHIQSEPVPLQEEIDFVLQQIGRYLSKDPQLSDIRSMFAGLRPLVKGRTGKTAALTRDHRISLSDSGLVSITGGKWTTYRRMAEDVLDFTIRKFGLKSGPCLTKEMSLVYIMKDQDDGADSPGISRSHGDLIPMDSGRGHPEEDEKIYPDSDIVKKQLRLAVRNEMCMTVEDFLSRRTRQLLLDARTALRMAPTVARLMAIELDRDEQWIQEQINIFSSLAGHYLPT
ncbi:MAG: glycerol-3-phosphate dehydrogenase/oxidase [Chitinophagaceae bacterium]